MSAIIAVNPQQMAEAQGQVTHWAEARLEEAKAELAALEEVHDALAAANMSKTRARVPMRQAHHRITFYEKVLAALRAGYYIVPPFPVQWFAIRTKSTGPDADESKTRMPGQFSPDNNLPVGEGRFVDPEPRRRKVGTIPERKGYGANPDETYEVALYGNDAKWRDVQLPLRAVKPTIIEAVGRVLEERIFDAIGILPAYRAADPLIVGELIRPDGKVMTFFVAWWLDQADL